MEPILWITFRFHFGSEAFCFYCGEIPDATDHVIPNSFLTLEDRERWDRGIFTPACRKCNHTLSDKIFFTLQKRCDYVQQCVERKSRSILRCEEWHPEEIAELKSTLRSKVVEMMEKQKIAKRRTSWKYTDQFAALWEEAYQKSLDRHPNKPELHSFMAHPWQKTQRQSPWGNAGLEYRGILAQKNGSGAAN